MVASRNLRCGLHPHRGTAPDRKDERKGFCFRLWIQRTIAHHARVDQRQRGVCMLESLLSLAGPGAEVDPT